jgi:hypothetical protein
MKCYLTAEGDTWTDIYKGVGVTRRDRSIYVSWLVEEQGYSTGPEQAAMEEVEAEAAMMPAAVAAAPPSPVMDAPAPPRPAVVSEDTKTFDRGRRRREGKHTHTHIPSRVSRYSSYG